jgi:hypothetical protein
MKEENSVKTSTFIIVIIFTIVTVLSGCMESKNNVVVSNEEEIPEDITEQANEQINEESNEQTNEQTIGKEEINNFALSINDTFINLRDWDYEANIEELLGAPISQEIEEIEGAGQLTGSFIKKIEYDGLQFELFSPMQNGKDFWIMTMETSKKGYKTSKGIEIGNTVDEIKDAYPNISIALDGRTDPNNCAYALNNEDSMDYSYLQFEVKDGLVSLMKIFYLIP